MKVPLLILGFALLLNQNVLCKEVKLRKMKGEYESLLCYIKITIEYFLDKFTLFTNGDVSRSSKGQTKGFRVIHSGNVGG